MLRPPPQVAVAAALLAPAAARAGDARPPAATLGTGTARVVMALGSYCWKVPPHAQCADMAPPGMRTDIPALTVHRGTLLTVRLAFPATRWTAAAWRSRTGAPLPPGRQATLRAAKSGLIVIDASSRTHGSASYLVRLRVR